MALACLWLGLRPYPAEAAPSRVVSLDYCADQYVIALAERDAIVGVSPAATSDYSYLADRVGDLPRVRPNAEAVLLAEPDLVVRQWGGGFNARNHLDRLGIPVAQIAFGNSVASARDNLRAMGAALGAQDRAEALLRAMDTALARIAAEQIHAGEPPTALYLTPGGFTSGAGTFVDEMLSLAGVRNFGAVHGGSGWIPVNLEQLVSHPPDMIVGAFFDLASNHVTFWSLGRHAFVQDMLRQTPTLFVPGRLVSCSAWFFVEAVEAVHTFARSLDGQPNPVSAKVKETPP